MFLLCGIVQTAVVVHQLTSLIPTLIELVLANWEHPFRHIASLMRPMFEKIFIVKVCNIARNFEHKVVEFFHEH